MNTSHRAHRRDRLVEQFQVRIVSQALRPGDRLPSVRQLAQAEQVSPATAAAAYEALTALGVITARRGSGYYVAGATPFAPSTTPVVPADALWERRAEAPGSQIRVDAGGGWLPTAWQYLDGVSAAMRLVARQPSHAEGYGSPHGYEALRVHFARQLLTRGVAADPARIVLTQGASQALDLVVRALLQPGDTVVVEDPTYPPTLELLRARGVRLISVPRLADGPDVASLARLLKRRRIRALFTNTTLQNPTGTSTSTEVGQTLVHLAHAHDYRIVEDDIFSELARVPVIPLAAYDDGSRVLHVSSVSKTVSPALRVGYVLASDALLAAIIRLKTLSALASSELSERIALGALTNSHYRRHLAALRRRLADSQSRVQTTLLAHGVELAHRPDAGMFLWGRLPSRAAVGKLWQDAVDGGVLLAPGESFRADGRASPWWRFNVAQSEDGALARFLAKTQSEA